MSIVYPTKSIQGQQIRLHRIIFSKFLGRKLTSSEIVHHIDGNVHNNDIANLELTTRAGHKKRHSDIGKNTQFKKMNIFSDNEIENIIELYKSKTLKEIARIYKTSTATIHRIVGFKPKTACICGNIISVESKSGLCRKCYKAKWFKEKHAGNR